MSSRVPRVELTILMPCLNEAETLAACIRKAKRYLRESRIAGEILVADNGSTDGSQALARRNRARVVRVAEKGYGNALLRGIAAARGRYVIMGDADDSYDFYRLDAFVKELRAGADLVMGNRFQGGIAPGAMPWLHRYLGNPVLSALGRLFFHSRVGDFQCGLRAFKKDSIQRLDLQTTGMEFASEMVVKASLFGLRVAEVPTTLEPAGRGRPPHLQTWRDGWRYLRFLLFVQPSLALLVPRHRPHPRRSGRRCHPLAGPPPAGSDHPRRPYAPVRRHGDRPRVSGSPVRRVHEGFRHQRRIAP